MPLNLKHVARGIGGVDEMSLHLDESKVLFGVLRFVFGKGTFARTKYVACHFNGRELYNYSYLRTSHNTPYKVCVGFFALNVNDQTRDSPRVVCPTHRAVVSHGETRTRQRSEDCSHGA